MAKEKTRVKKGKVGKACSIKESLEDLKKEYNVLQKKYSLPSFDELNKDFVIEKIACEETEFLLREIRRFIGEKVLNYFRFIETLLHPVNAPMFYFSLLKILTIKEKKILGEAYKKLMKIEVELIELDLVYDELKEALFINRTYKLWQDIKSDLLEVLAAINKNWDVKIDPGNNNKGYFG